MAKISDLIKFNTAKINFIYLYSVCQNKNIFITYKYYFQPLKIKAVPIVIPFVNYKYSSISNSI